MKSFRGTHKKKSRRVKKTRRKIYRPKKNINKTYRKKRRNKRYYGGEDYRKYCYKNIGSKLAPGEKIAVKITDSDLLNMKKICYARPKSCNTNNMMFCKSDNCDNCIDEMWQDITKFK